MQIFFAGAEVSSHLSLLKECGVDRVAVSVSNLARTSTKLDGWASRQRFGSMEWVLYADSPHTPVGSVLELLRNYEVAPEIIAGPVDWYESTWLGNSDLLFLPVWDGGDPTVLRDITQNYDGVVLPDDVVDNTASVRQARASLGRLSQLGAITGRSKGLERFDTLISSAWWAVQKYGETQVWAANRMVRLNSEDKRLKRERYAPAIEALGCDVGKVLMDDPTETVRLAVLSWMSLEQHLVPGAGVLEHSEVAIPGGDPNSNNVVPIRGSVASAPSRGRHLLPVISTGSHTVTTTDDAGNEVDTQLPIIQVGPDSLRQCNTCSLQIGCPGFTPHSECSFQIPVEIKTKTQLVGVLRAITEVQTQRILMGRFAEEVRGEPDPDLGKEMDRLFNMVERWRNIEDTRDSVRVSLEAKGEAAAQMGVLSRLFGQKVGQNATLLDAPMSSDAVIEQMTED